MVKRKKAWGVFGFCLLVAFACLLVCSKSSPLYPINDWTDANAFLTSGKGMLAGRVMYRDLYEHKGPLLYALHALCALVDGAGFTGVFMLEVLAAALFLLAAYRLLALYGVGRSALFALPVIAALTYSSFSFQQGDSAEELCLPLLAWAVYLLLAWWRERAPRRIGAGRLVLGGVLFGCVLWIKFTLIGLFAPWILGLICWHAVRRQWRDALGCAMWFTLGLLVATLPWLVYFGLNGAIGDWLKTYLYDNLFLYSGGEGTGIAGHVKAVLHAVWDWLRLNLPYTLPLGLGLLAFALWPQKRTDGDTAPITRWEKTMVLLMAGFTGLGVFIGGKSYVYYGLMLAAFMPFAALPFCSLAAGMPHLKRPLGAALLCVVTAASVWFGISVTPNRAWLLKPRNETMQYQLAAVIRQTPDATLLNYGFMDAGFYTAAGIAPTVKYYHQTNVPLQEMYDQQARYVADGITDYVVSRAVLPAAISGRYTLVATAKPPKNFWYQQVYLYQRSDLLP